MENNIIKIPKGATVFRFYEQPDGEIHIAFESGNPEDYIWTTWENSNWKSIDWIMGKVPNNELNILKEK